MMKNNFKIFDVSSEEFDKWISSADLNALSSTATAVIEKIKSGKLSHEDLRRINAYYEKTKKIYWPFRMDDWFKYHFPVAALILFQIYLIAGKIWGFGPFYDMSWNEVFLPIYIDLVVSFIFTIVKG